MPCSTREVLFSNDNAFCNQQLNMQSGNATHNSVRVILIKYLNESSINRIFYSLVFFCRLYSNVNATCSDAASYNLFVTVFNIFLVVLPRDEGQSSSIFVESKVYSMLDK